jgi:hypothetical protein
VRDLAGIEDSGEPNATAFLPERAGESLEKPIPMQVDCRTRQGSCALHRPLPRSRSRWKACKVQGVGPLALLHHGIAFVMLSPLG